MSTGTFSFPYQSILDVREQQRKGLQIELAGLESTVLEHEENCRRWETTRHDILALMRRAREAGDMGENTRGAQYLRHVNDRTTRWAQKAQATREERESVRDELRRLAQSCKVLENYRDRLAAEHSAATEKAEERALDSHAIRRSLRAEDAA